MAGAGNTPVSVTAVSGRRFGDSLGLVSNMTAPSLVVLSKNPRRSMRGAGMMSLFLSMEKGRLLACPVVAVGCLSFDRADRGLSPNPPMRRGGAVGCFRYGSVFLDNLRQRAAAALWVRCVYSRWREKRRVR